MSCRLVGSIGFYLLHKHTKINEQVKIDQEAEKEFSLRVQGKLQQDKNFTSESSQQVP